MPIDGAPFEGGRGEGEIAELNEGRFIPGFVGRDRRDDRRAKARQVEAHFPDGYPVAELAGKPATFTITLKELKELELPPLDDAFAAQISENATLEQLRDDLRRRLEAVAVGRGRRAAGNAVMTKLLAAHDFALPESLVERELDHLAEDAAAGGQAEPPPRARRCAPKPSPA